MPDPRRVKVEGDLFHGRVPEGAVYVGRAAPGLKASPFRNRHPVGKPCRECGGAVHTLEESLACFRRDLLNDPDLLEQARQELAGRDLACWCSLSRGCHVDVILAVLHEDDAADDWCIDCGRRDCACVEPYVPVIQDVPTGGLL